MRLEENVALVTGAARGIGEAIARLFAKEGAAVVIGDILETEGEVTAEDMRAQGGEARFLRLDVTSEDSWQQAVRTIEDWHGKLNVLVNNAGLVDREAIEDTPLDLWERIMAVNITGVFLGTKHVIPAMRRAGGGSIINMSSAYGLIGTANRPAYTASKGGVRLFTKATAVEHAKEGIRANSIHPGFVVTPMTTSYQVEERIAQTPMGRLATPEDIAPGALFLASDDSRYMTGSELVIDGGLTVH